MLQAGRGEVVGDLAGDYFAGVQAATSASLVPRKNCWISSGTLSHA